MNCFSQGLTETVPGQARKACSGESEKTIYGAWRHLFRAAVRRPPGDTEAPRDQKQAEAITISSPEEGRAGTVLEGSSKSWSCREEPPHRSCPGGAEALSELQSKAGKRLWGKCPVLSHLLPELPVCRFQPEARGQGSLASAISRDHRSLPLSTQPGQISVQRMGK